VGKVQADLHELPANQQELRRPMNGYNFTERVRKVLAMAREEAARLHHEYVGPEHILLGLLREGGGVANTVLEQCGADQSALTEKIETTIKRGDRASLGPDLPYTTRAKRSLELSMVEARTIGHSYVGTEHLLMGLLLEGKNIAAQVLNDAGVTVDNARAAILAVLGEPASEAALVAQGGEAQDVALLLPNAPERLRRVLASAHKLAAEHGATELDIRHLLLALLRHGDGAGNAALDALRIDRGALVDHFQQWVSRDKGSEVPPEATVRVSPVVQRIMRRMLDEQRSLGACAPGTQHLLLALIGEAQIAGIFADQRISLEKIREEVRRMSG
jgi:ATP-dependent Clp protease ATP-binding subunit ClpA